MAELNFCYHILSKLTWAFNEILSYLNFDPMLNIPHCSNFAS